MNAMAEVPDDEGADFAARRREAVVAQGAHESDLRVGGVPDVPVPHTSRTGESEPEPG